DLRRRSRDSGGRDLRGCRGGARGRLGRPVPREERHPAPAGEARPDPGKGLRAADGATV
ncbi:MAG: hypothetical protein AVDCRST_MAG34-1769, partial [uncultured Nocardioidaceae bacterium]